MAIQGNQDRLMSDINVTPFVDVMLVLLIIFMVTAPMMMQGVDVALPMATSDPLPAEQEQLMISIDRENRVFLNNYQVELENLKEKLAKIIETRGSREVYLRADRDISYGMVVRVMSEVKAAGVENLGMVTTPLEDIRTDLNKKSRSR
jgi:biopolymer transport protein TolR